ncbi:unnamed protein product [Prunus armeniaca]
MDSMNIANADLLTIAHTCLNNPIYLVHLTPWKLYFDGSKIDLASGAGIVLEDPLGIKHCYSFQLDFQCTNNIAEYEALIIGLEMLVELGVQSVEILGDSMLPEISWQNSGTPLGNMFPREENLATNEMAQIATGVQMPEDCVQRIIKVGKKSLPSILTREMEIDINSAMISEEDWRLPLINYLQYPALPAEKRIRIMALNYVMWNEELVRKSKDELLLRCLGKEEYMKVMREVHEGICGAHQGSFSSQESSHQAMAIQTMGNGPHWQNLSSRGSSFMYGEMLDMAEAFKFKLLQSTHYYAQANGQVESSNKVIINIIRKMLEKNPNQWHEKLSETLWAYRTSKRDATGMTLYALTYGHDAILPMEIAVQSLRIAQQHNLVGEDYSQTMLLELEGLNTSKIDTLNKLLAGKQAVVRAYNKRVKNKSFEEGEIVWKEVLPLETHDQDGDIHASPINGKWLKKFYPTMWDSQAVQTDLGIKGDKDRIVV